MKNINNLREQVLEKLNIGEVVENFKPSTLSGTNFKKALVNGVNENKVQSVLGYLNVLNNAKGLQNVDSGVMHLVDVMENKLNADKFTNLLMVCLETVQADEEDKSKTKDSVLEKLERISTLDVNEAKNLIRSGLFGGTKSVYPVLNLLVNESVMITENKVETDEFKVYSPITYNVVENGNLFISFGNRTFVMNASHGVMETKSPSPKFSFITTVLERLDFNYEEKSFKYKDDVLGNIKLTNEGFERDGSVLDLETFIRNTSLVVETKVSNNYSQNAKKQVIDGLIAVQENISDIIVADNVLVVESKKGKFALFNVGEIGKYYVAVLESNYSPNVLEMFTETKGAVDFLLKRSDYNASTFLALESAKEVEENNEKEEIIKEQRDIINTLINKLNDINSLIHETKENDGDNEEKLEKLKEAKELTESLIVEQKSILVDMIK